MNATERAERVHEEVNRRCLAYHTVRDACVKSIAAELEAYAAERVSEAVCAEIERQRISWKQTCDQAVEEDHPCYGTGYRTGIEDAAKIAQDESLRYAGKALLASDALADVAKAIRALAKETASGS